MGLTPSLSLEFYSQTDKKGTSNTQKLQCSHNPNPQADITQFITSKAEIIHGLE
jgi:hypothetical protein